MKFPPLYYITLMGLAESHPLYKPIYPREIQDNPERVRAVEMRYIKLSLRYVPFRVLLDGVGKIERNWSFCDVYKFIKKKYGEEVKKNEQTI